MREGKEGNYCVVGEERDLLCGEGEERRED